MEALITLPGTEEALSKQPQLFSRILVLPSSRLAFVMWTQNRMADGAYGDFWNVYWICSLAAAATC